MNSPLLAQEAAKKMNVMTHQMRREPHKPCTFKTITKT